MTKKEFIDAIEHMPDNAPIFFWDFSHDCWMSGKPYLMENTKHHEYDENGEEITYTFIGIE